MSPWITSTSSTSDAELVGDDLRERRLVALAVRGRARDHLHRAERLEPHRRRVPATDGVADRAEDARRREPAHLVVRREADADLLRVTARTTRRLIRADRVEIEQLEQAVEACVVVARVDREARRHRVRELRDEVLAPKLERVHAELARERVHRALEHVRRLRPAGSAIGVRRSGVREDAGERDAVVRYLVRPGVDPRAEERDAGRHELQVRAHGAPGFRLDRRDVAVLRRRERELVDDVASVDRSHVVLGSLLRPLHRAAETACERDRERALAVDLELRAEASTDVGCDHADLGLGDAEHELQREARDVRRLRRRPERDLAGRADLREHATGLDRVRDEPRLVVAARDDDVGGVDRCLDVVGLELPDVALVRAEVLVHERSAVRERLLDVGVRRERLVVDLDELRRVLREGTALGHDDGHGSPW